MSRLLENATENGSGDPIDWNGNQSGALQIVGPWGGATVTIEGSLDGSNFQAPPNNESQFIDDVLISFAFPTGKIRATVTNAGPETNLNAYVEPG